MCNAKTQKGFLQFSGQTCRRSKKQNLPVLTTVLELFPAPEVALDLRDPDPLPDLDVEDLSDEGEREVVDPVEGLPRVLVVLPRQEGGLLHHGPAPWQLCSRGREGERCVKSLKRRSLSSASVKTELIAGSSMHSEAYRGRGAKIRNYLNIFRFRLTKQRDWANERDSRCESE